MLAQGLQRFTAEAVVPEQLLHYVAAVAGSRPLDCAGCPAYVQAGHVVLVAYDAAMPEAFAGAAGKTGTDTPPQVRQRVDAATECALALPGVKHITVLAPVRPAQAPAAAISGPADAYWELSLPLLRTDGSLPWQKLRNMVRRALREVEVRSERWQPEHAALVQDFVRRRPLEAGTVHIFGRLEAYAASHADVLLLSARRRDDGALQAFVLGDYASLSTAFYMFAFRRQDAVPGCADALLAALVREAEMRGHSRFCLGLGIDAGIRFFKRKWHAHPALPCVETGWDVESACGDGWFARLRHRLGRRKEA